MRTESAGSGYCQHMGGDFSGCSLDETIEDDGRSKLLLTDAMSAEFEICDASTAEDLAEALNLLIEVNQ